MLTDAPRVEANPVEAMPPEQAQAIITAFQGHPLEGLVIVALATGMRLGELLGLRWADVDLDAGVLTVRHQLQRISGVPSLVPPKSRKSLRNLDFYAPVVDALRAHRARQLSSRLAAADRWHDTGHVFASTVGTPLDGINVLKRFQSRLAAAGLPKMRIHDLRHGVATLMLLNGEGLRTVMEQLGDSQISLTANTYAHVLPALKKQAANRLGATLFGANGYAAQ